MSDGGLSAAVKDWAVPVTVALAAMGGVFGYGQLSQRVKSLEDLQPVLVTTKLAVIEADGKRAANDIATMQKDLAEIRRLIVESGRREHP